MFDQSDVYCIIAHDILNLLTTLTFVIHNPYPSLTLLELFEEFRRSIRLEAS